MKTKGSRAPRGNLPLSRRGGGKPLKAGKPRHGGEEAPSAACEHGDGIKDAPTTRGGADAAAPRARPPKSGHGGGSTARGGPARVPKSRW